MQQKWALLFPATARDTSDVEPTVVINADGHNCVVRRHNYTLLKIQTVMITTEYFSLRCLLYLPSSRTKWVRVLFSSDSGPRKLSDSFARSEKKLNAPQVREDLDPDDQIRNSNFFTSSQPNPHNFMSSSSYQAIWIVWITFCIITIEWFCPTKFKSCSRRNVEERFGRITFRWSSNEVKEKYVSLTYHNSYCLSHHREEKFRNFNQIKWIVIAWHIRLFNYLLPRHSHPLLLLPHLSWRLLQRPADEFERSCPNNERTVTRIRHCEIEKVIISLYLITISLILFASRITFSSPFCGRWTCWLGFRLFDLCFFSINCGRRCNCFWSGELTSDVMWNYGPHLRSQDWSLYLQEIPLAASLNPQNWALSMRWLHLEYK